MRTTTGRMTLFVLLVALAAGVAANSVQASPRVQLRDPGRCVAGLGPGKIQPLLSAAMIGCDASYHSRRDPDEAGDDEGRKEHGQPVVRNEIDDRGPVQARLRRACPVGCTAGFGATCIVTASRCAVSTRPSPTFHQRTSIAGST